METTDNTQAPEIVEGRLQIHNSHISTLSRCGYQFEQFVLNGLRIPPGVALHVGSATHKGVEVNLQRMIDTGEMAPREEVVEVARDTLHDRWEREGAELQDEEAEQGEQRTRDAAAEEAMRLALLHRDHVAPLITPLAVEEPFVLSIDAINADLAGRIDVRDGVTSLRDTKTAKRAPSADDIAIDQQVRIYALALHVSTGAESVDVHKDHLVKTKEAKAVTQGARVEKADFAPVLARVEQAARVIRSGVFTPASPGDWCCSTRWCGLARRGLCPFFLGRKSVAMPS